MPNKPVPPHLSKNREAPNKHEKGTKAYREWVQKESKRSDDYGNLPYQFSKPKRDKPRNLSVSCLHCGEVTNVTETTVAVICRQCGNLYRVSEENSCRVGYDTVDTTITSETGEKGDQQSGKTR